MTALEYSLLHPTIVVEEVTVVKHITDPGVYVQNTRYWLNGKRISVQDYMKYEGIGRCICKCWW